MLLMASQEKAMVALTRPDWRASLSAIFDTPTLRERQIGALVADHHGTVLWRTAEYAPAWPPDKDSTLSEKNGPLVLYVSLPEAMFEHERRLHALFLLSGAAVIAFGFASWLLVGRTLSPIRALAHQASNASVDEVGTRLASPSQDAEMLQLVDTLNGFLGRMEESSQQKAHFYAAASHELRTPLQALSGHLEVALAQPREATEYQAALREAHGQSQRLVSLVDAILLLHRLQGVPPEHREPACLTRAVEETLDILQPLIEARNLRLEVHLQENQRVISVPMHLNVLVRNLLENAARYGLEGGTLEVCLEAGRLKIENEVGDGVVLDPEKLFEPFHRAEASRSAKLGGNGLGLAICQAVAKANGWSLSLLQQGRWVTALVEFDN
jgi:signal transduction histidine kinase